MNILVVGSSVRHIACSAVRAGHRVYAADRYCDLDLEECTLGLARLDPSRGEEELELLLERFSPDAVVLGPGLEEARVKGVRVLGNPPELVGKVSDKLWLARWLEDRGYPFIKTWASGQGVPLPAVLKPRKGAGGVGCRLAVQEEDLNAGEGLILQEWVEGLPASASVIGSSREAVAVSLNEQLIGAHWAGAEGFKYSGNITPLEPPCPGMAELAEAVVSELGLTGSCGVDFLVTRDGPVVVEVNPRFQGSLDAVELSTGLNIFQAHLRSFFGLLPERPRPAISAGRAIVYAWEDLQIEMDLSNVWTRDVPRPGIIKKGDPVASVLAVGGSRGEVLALLKERAAGLGKRIKPV
jgi:predicted ATP-grasp superfamily ATP-dependent carboligase